MLVLLCLEDEKLSCGIFFKNHGILKVKAELRQGFKILVLYACPFLISLICWGMV